MTLCRLVGDIHGLLYDFKVLVDHAPDNVDKIIQLGDFGIGFDQSDYWHESLDDYMVENNVFFLRGNHDNPFKCAEMKNNLSGGNYQDFFVVPGAWSIDNPVAPPGWHRRIAGVDWWFDEECSDQEFESFFQSYIETKPRVMITHDIPKTASYEMFWKSGILRGPVYPNRTAQWFDHFFQHHQPEFWFHGHWHNSMMCKIENTTFVCLDELDWIDVDLSDSEKIYHALDEKFIVDKYSK